MPAKNKTAAGADSPAEGGQFKSPAGGRAFKSPLAILGGAVLSAAVSSLCCLGPLLYLVFGVSAAGLTGLGRLSFLRAPLTILSLLFVGYGFWKLYFSSAPICSGWLSLPRMRLLYWLSVPVILFFILYPFIFPIILEALE